MDAHVCEHHRDRLAATPDEFIQISAGVLVQTIRTSLPVLMHLAQRLDRARTWSEIEAIEAEMTAWMCAVQRATPKH
jgi:hypothetical protein